MRLSATLLVVAAAGLFATGHAASDVSQPTIPQSLDVGQLDPGAETVTPKRLLRAVCDDNEEERGAWSALLSRFPGTAKNLAREAEKQTAKIKLYADDFATYRANGDVPYEVTVAYMVKGYSDSRAVNTLRDLPGKPISVSLIQVGRKAKCCELETCLMQHLA
ncbi:avirulence protein 1b [Phytophthora sojae]|uniref:RxLR effector protein n=2 Tax=Phytophthora sojae TaxID=67593 RepID=G4YZ12_PHYSP|nr:avirulence protein 1b [Phytophthora sojae]AEK80492.1 Avh20 [Phytophthora sojae]EGZ23293.1 avirulence protein 1b [Phytophthora sojae]|eukprot:XP_009518581.1 avirulence protein 1b [Phytophthora sojae]